MFVSPNTWHSFNYSSISRCWISIQSIAFGIMYLCLFCREVWCCRIGGSLIGKRKIPCIVLYACIVYNSLDLICAEISNRANCDILKVMNDPEECPLGDNMTMTALCQLESSDRLWIFTLFTVVTIILNLLRSGLIYALVINASRVLHNRMFASVLRAPAKFFDTNPSGESICASPFMYLYVRFSQCIYLAKISPPLYAIIANGT